jgi:hypothetical protein
MFMWTYSPSQRNAQEGEATFVSFKFNFVSFSFNLLR